MKQEFYFEIQKVYSLLKMSVKKVYGCAANVKFRLGNIFRKALVLGGKRDENPTVTRQVFMNYKVQKSKCSVSEPLFVYSFHACSKVLCLGAECLGSRGMLPQKIFKIDWLKCIS